MTRARDLAAFVSNADGDIKFDTDTLFIDSSENRVGIGNTAPDTMIHGLNATAPVLKLERDSTSLANNNIIGEVRMSHKDSNDAGDAVRIIGRAEGTAGAAGLAFTTGTPSGGAERMRILADGGLTFNGDTAAANALNDYEEGTYTVTIGTSISGSVTLNSTWQYGSYVKVGNIVHAQGAVDQASASSPTGYFTISLPFTAKSDSPEQAYRGSASVTVYNTVSANMADFVPLLVQGESSLRVYLGDGTALQGDSAQQLNNGASPRIGFQITYRAT